MKLGTIGVGNAGSKVVDKMVEFESLTGRNLCRHVMVINTARTDLAKPDHVEDDRRVLIGDTHQKAKGHGVGGDVDVGAEVAVDITPGRKLMSAIAFAVGMEYDADHVFYFYISSEEYFDLLYPEIPRSAANLYDFSEGF